jgi:protein ImuB
MSARARRTAGRRAGGWQVAHALTADLFAAPPPPLESTACAALPMPAPAPVPAIAPVPAPAPHAAPRAALHPLPGPQAGTARLAKQLWYAAVFPDLPEISAAATLQRLSLYAQQFTSLVSIELPNALLLEIKGSIKLFGSLEILHASLAATWERLSLRVQSATAPTTLAALWLARAGRESRLEDPGALAGALAALPLVCTAWDAERLQTLRSMGVTRMGELLRLPRAGVARRLSPAAVLDLDIALARQSAPRRAFVALERFRERGDFETEIETVGYLQKAIEPFVDHCARFLRERQAGVQALELRLRHRVIPVTRVRVGLASITSDRRRLADVLDERLGRLELPAPVRGMELLSGTLQPLSANSLDAFAGLRGGGRDTAPQLVERLRARLGEAAVYGVASIEEHRPEAAWQRVHELRLTTPVHVTDASKGGLLAGGLRVGDRIAHDMPRPVWLLAEPATLSAEDLQQLQRGALVLEEGPERIESGWWDGKGVARDYYIARQMTGSRWWIFQERQTKCWFLHGVFA